MVANNTVVNSGYAGIQTWDYPTTDIVNNILWGSGSYDVRFYSTSSQNSLTYENNDASTYLSASPVPTGIDGNIDALAIYLTLHTPRAIIVLFAP